MRTRKGCCADWPKPCQYHEGWSDAEDALDIPWTRDELMARFGIGCAAIMRPSTAAVAIEVLVAALGDTQIPQNERKSEMGKFHWKDGWHFERRENGSVEITRTEMVDGQQVTVDRASIPQAEWCSIMVAVADCRDSAAAYKAAGALHAGDV